jgi:hypothetical protein
MGIVGSGSGDEKKENAGFLHPANSVLIEVQNKGNKERDDKVSRLQVVGQKPTTPTQGHQCHRSPERDWNVGANRCFCTSYSPSVPSRHELEIWLGSHAALGPSELVVAMFRSCFAS